MGYRKQVHDFAIKWFDKFRDRNINYEELVDPSMADDCDALGFEMDCGHAFLEKYGLAATDYEELDKIIDDVTDIPLLGSAIYSWWRYYNHWAHDAAEILEPQNRAWFILALSRLALLSGENPFIFQGTLKKASIVSNIICFGSVSEPDEKVEQHLTINDEGCVWFCEHIYRHGGEKYEKVRSRNFRIEKVDADKLLGSIAAYFSNGYYEIFETDIGDWVMELTNTEGVTYKFRGSLCAGFNNEYRDLSDLVRDVLGMDDLNVFDGNYKPDVINKITLDYQRLTKIKPEEVPDGTIWEHVTWDYTEHVIIDRETETIEFIQKIGSGCKISHKYEIEGGTESLLETFDAEELFTNVAGNSDDVIDNPNETREYKITIDYKKSPQRVIEGSYDKNGLPEDFAHFAETVFEFIRFYGMGEIFDPSVYGKKKRRQSDYIFCSIIFNEGYKSYYYITDDDIIEIGDFVLVPAGKDNHEAVVEVVNIEYFSEENVPFPVDITKRIIRKCKDEDFDLQESE